MSLTSQSPISFNSCSVFSRRAFFLGPVFLTEAEYHGVEDAVACASVTSSIYIIVGSQLLEQPDILKGSRNTFFRNLKRFQRFEEKSPLQSVDEAVSIRVFYGQRIAVKANLPLCQGIYTGNQVEDCGFPAPLGPISPKISPSFMVKETSPTAVRPPKRFVTCSNLSTSVMTSHLLPLKQRFSAFSYRSVYS